MRKFIKHLMIGALMLGMILPASAHINPKLESKPAGNNSTNAATVRNDCSPGIELIEQSINNVRATLLTSGDVWWNGDAGRYVIPKVDPSSGLPEVSSIFAGAVWLGGFEGTNLKVACQQYGSAQGNVDFWPGPLTEVGTTEAETCDQWDRHFVVTGEEILEHLSKVAQGTEYDPADIPDGVKYYPAIGNQYFADRYGFELPDAVQGLGSFFDATGDGIYEPLDGDYPSIEVRGCGDDVYPDELIFWIYNDAGNEHDESGGQAIRMEVQVQAFGFQTNDELNNMTFQRYKLINRAVSSIDSTYFAMWVDPDLGCYTDDYIGCDTTRSLMYIYNADALDGQTGCSCPGGVETYCDEIPMLGVDYFRGPLAPKKFGPGGTLINPLPGENGDTIVELGMSSFTYFNNGGENPAPPPGTDDPATSVEFYNYLSGRWRDGSPFIGTGDGHDLTQTNGINFAFPDAPNVSGGWSMAQEGLDERDRRTVQASGPFRLDPGAVNELIIGVPWVPSVSHPAPSISKLAVADDLAQALFNGCFETNNGPDAPDVEWVELDRAVVALLSNDEGDGALTNNECEQYVETDLRAPPGIAEDSTYNFEGYLIYQIASPNSAGEADLNDPDHYRLVAQVDIKNGVRDLYEWRESEDPTNPDDKIYTPFVRVENAGDAGIRHVFEITQDLFASGDTRLINHKKYYYRAIAYGWNNYAPFSPATGLGQPRPFIASQRNIGDGDNSYYTVIPRPIVDQVLNASVGDEPQITRLDGVGVGETDVRITEETRTAILDGTFDGSITYESKAGPIQVTVYNPLEVIEGDFELKFTDDNPDNEVLDNNVNWILNELDGPGGNVVNTIESKVSIDVLNEQLLAEYGFSISIVQSQEPGSRVGDNNGAIGATKVYSDPLGPEWLSGVPDGPPPFNYVKTSIGERDVDLDPTSQLSTMGDGTWIPYTLCDWVTSATNPTLSPAWMSSTSNIIRNGNPLDSVPNIDIVFTSDRDLWSKCIVVETSSFLYEDLGWSNQGGTDQFNLRSATSKNRDGSDIAGDTGSSWFPGYAIDVETGKRVNIFFGENSVYSCENIPAQCDNGVFQSNDGQPVGGDMIWNPTDERFINSGSLIQGDILNVYEGGQHHIYVTNDPYDECASLKTLLESGGTDKIRALRKIRWTSYMIMEEGESLLPLDQGLIPNDVTVHLRVDNPYKEYRGAGTNNGLPSYTFTTRGLSPSELTTDDEINAALDAINVVPNPYYGFSDYEVDQFSNLIKITNLPAQCVVTIYSLEGKFIRQYQRDEQGISTEQENNPSIRTSQYLPDIEWDLKNNAGIPVASGVYLIHVDAGELGERTVKWFGVARQFDPTGL